MNGRAPAWSPGWRARVVDARGVVRPSRYLKERWMWGGKSYQVIRREMIRGRGRFVLSVLMMVGAYVGVAALVIWVLQLFSGPFYRGLGLAATISGTVGALLFYRVGPTRSAAERVLARWTGEMRRDDPCLACGYPLEGAATGADGCVECPECGAAWRVGT